MLVVVVGGRRSAVGFGADDFLMGAFSNSQRNDSEVVIIAALDVDVMTTF